LTGANKPPAGLELEREADAFYATREALGGHRCRDRHVAGLESYGGSALRRLQEGRDLRELRPVRSQHTLSDGRAPRPNKVADIVDIERLRRRHGPVGKMPRIALLQSPLDLEQYAMNALFDGSRIGRRGRPQDAQRIAILLGRE
jgi:hypothetical protein